MRKTKCIYFLNVFFYIALIMLVMILLFPYTKFYENKSLFQSFFERVNTKTIYMEKGSTCKMNLFLVNQRVTYQSQNFRIADINQFGKISGKNTGNTMILVKTKKKTLKCRVYVIALNKGTISCKKGEQTNLKVKGTSAWVKWKSEDQSIAKVTRFGKVTGVKSGTTYVIAKVKGITLKCEIIVI
ncbi:Ig-like domain-containing protein [Anaeromicropila populeti]|uniref:Ig-like domain (Group 2) n=1 Tax=Anaeromicropila populeti TaxID=37658 RepID=A0A1I6L5T5_9FIRM|nr:Ig-like domain-containing protein [Anaeromicropila populeti]SFR98841.1 Ig-like domain (group 2) [Anaeromicropila populeti]